MVPPERDEAGDDGADEEAVEGGADAVGHRVPERSLTLTSTRSLLEDGLSLGV